MRPVLFTVHVGGHDLGPHTYGLLIVVGFALGIWLAVREARRLGEPDELVLDLCFWVLLAGLAGARVLYIATTAPDYWASCADGGAGRSWAQAAWDCTRVLHVWEGGLVFYGGFAGAAVAVVLFVRHHRLRFLRMADLLVPSLALGHFFGRIGCLAAGCCFGRVAPALPWGIRFPAGSMAFQTLFAESRGALTPRLHPTQLYEAGFELGLFFVLLAARARKRYDGQPFLLYLVAYPLLRSLVEIFRGDAIRKFVVELPTPRLARALGLPPGEPCFLSTSQFLSALALLAALALLVREARRARRRERLQIAQGGAQPLDAVEGGP